jgi:ABC-2 type transport system ATP-binding protein
MDAVVVENLTVQFGDFKAVDDISFNVSKGDIFGFLGANGAGKTTAIRVLCGLLKPTSGFISIAGEVLRDDGENFKSRVGYMSQKFTLYDDLTIEENLAFTSSLRKLEKDYFLSRRKYLLEFIGFKKDLKTFVRDLPSGVKQQISLVSSLLHDPDIIFLDEPTAGVTPAARGKFWDLIKQLAVLGKTIFITTHYMDEVEQCGHIALMRAGKLIALDTVDNLKKDNFPFGIIDLRPIKKLDQNVISHFKAHRAFESFQPYGIRYHASLKSQNVWDEVKDELSQYFEYSVITPSLEDVFIKLVEGQTR